MLSEEDRVFVARLAHGDREANDELYRRYSEGINRYCRAILHDAVEADDATQNTFLAAFDGMNELRDGASLRSWIFRIARNECLMTARRKSRLLPLDVEPANPGSETPLTLAVASEFRVAVREAVHALSPLYREAIVLREFEGLSYREIADATGAPVSTVKFRLFKARERLVRLLQDVLDDRRE